MNLKEYLLARQELNLLIEALPKDKGEKFINAWRNLDETTERIIGRCDSMIKELNESNSCLLKNNFHQNNIIQINEKN